MRLIHLDTMGLVEFATSEAAPPYVILSHRWETEELVYENYDFALRSMLQQLVENSGNRADSVSSSLITSAMAKVAGFCIKARNLGSEYGWVDSLCINKSSSAELSESINSMWKWYKDAKICLAYLSDTDSRVNSPESANPFLTTMTTGGWEGGLSVWFSRGWTLQELLAPENVIFFDCAWEYIGDRKLSAEQLSLHTGIPKHVLEYGYRPMLEIHLEPSSDTLHSSSNPFQWIPKKRPELCVAQKLAWAKQRQTTRPEDIAYSLMGLFGVNMPILYGEGEESAFYRLQVEIFQTTADYSIFAWVGRTIGPQNMLSTLPNFRSTLFAPTIRHFRDGNTMAIIPNYQDLWSRFPAAQVTESQWGMSTFSSGLRLELPMITLPPERPTRYLALLPVTARHIVDGLSYGHPADVPPCYAIVLQDAHFFRKSQGKNFFRDHEPRGVFAGANDIGIRDDLHYYFNNHGSAPEMIGIRTVFIPTKLPPFSNVAPDEKFYVFDLQYSLTLPPAFRTRNQNFTLKTYEILGNSSKELWLQASDTTNQIRYSFHSPLEGQFRAEIRPRNVFWVEVCDVPRGGEGLQIFLITPWSIPESNTPSLHDSEYVRWITIEVRTFVRDRRGRQYETPFLDVQRDILYGQLDERSTELAYPQTGDIYNRERLRITLVNTINRSWTLRLPKSWRSVLVNVNLKKSGTEYDKGKFSLEVQVSLLGPRGMVRATLEL